MDRRQSCDSIPFLSDALDSTELRYREASEFGDGRPHAQDKNAAAGELTRWVECNQRNGWAKAGR